MGSTGSGSHSAAGSSAHAQLFSQLDKNSDGYLSRSEITASNSSSQQR
jgi:hypothetical protein